MGREVREGSFFSSHAEAVQLTLRCMDDADRFSGYCDAGYLFAVTPENTFPIIARAAKLYKNTNGVRVGKLVLLGLARKRAGDYGTPAMSDSLEDYGGPLLHLGHRGWKFRLRQDGVLEKDIITSLLSEPIYEAKFYNTHTEAVAFIKMARDNDWRNLVIISHSAHIVRATAETVTAALNFYPKARVFVAAGRNLSWIEQATQSQSDNAKSRIASVVDEVARLDTYYRYGDTDLRPAKEILAYFDERDGECKAAFDALCMD